MASATLTGIYTLTPTHCGTGQTSGAVDLPIAREQHTGLPVLPASGLKGAARQAIAGPKGGTSHEHAKCLFGPELEDSPRLEAGSLVILEGRLLLFPLRSLQRPLLYATCPLILERLQRDLRALDLDELLGSQWVSPEAPSGARVTDRELVGKPLVLEDLVYKGEEVGELLEPQPVIRLLSSLLPGTEQASRKRLSESLVVIGDTEFADVVGRAVPVQARTKLTEAKTTDETESGEKGNLWYEEALPPDCLFGVLVTERAGAKPRDCPKPVDLFVDYLGKRRSVQLGGNETVGQGRCWWSNSAMTSGSKNGGGSRG